MPPIVELIPYRDIGDATPRDSKEGAGEDIQGGSNDKEARLISNYLYSLFDVMVPIL